MNFNQLPGWNMLVGTSEYLGPAGIALVALSIVATALILLKLGGIMISRLRRASPLEHVLEAMERDGPHAASAALGNSRHPIAKLMRSASQLAIEGYSRPVIEAELRKSAMMHLDSAARYNRAIEVIGLIAPLLGLLGTILGMIGAFKALQESGAQADPAVLAGGIWEALLTTAIGLVIAIPAIVVFNIAESRVEALRQEISSQMGRFLARLERQD